MTNTSKKQISLAVLAVVFATTMIASIIATSDNAFARNTNNKFASQSIGQNCSQHQKSSVVTAGAISPPILSGNNIGLCVNLNGGGNALSQ
jgi:hypothetical protein